MESLEAPDSLKISNKVPEEWKRFKLDLIRREGEDKCGKDSPHHHHQSVRFLYVTWTAGRKPSGISYISEATSFR